MKQRSRILSAILGQPWAIWPPDMENILAILERPVPDLEALASRDGRPLENTGNRVETRGSTAILAVEGPIFRYANLFTMISGATSVELLAKDFETAVANPQIERVVLTFDTPGGEVAGISAMGDMIRAANDRKPVIAYVERAASAGYWLASAASHIVADKSAFTGSLGVIATMTDNRGAQERQGVKRYDIISSQSPYKRPDPATEQGMNQLQAMVDEMAQQFIDAVAGFRGVSSEDVLARFGQGRMVSAFVSKERGMIDEIQAFEPFLNALNTQNKSFVSMAATAAEENTMAEPNAASAQPIPAAAPAPPPAPAPLPLAAGPQPGPAERARCQAILAHPEAEGRRDLAQYLAFQTDFPAEQAAMILKTSPKGAQPGAHAGPLAAAMAQLPNPRVSALSSADDSDTSDAAEVQRVLGFVPKQFKVNAR